MFLTLYYMAATWIQSWRLRSVSTKLAKHISERMSVVFYNIQDEPGGLPTTPLSSELCTNYSQARIADVFWYQGNQRGAAVLPMQNIHLGPWITFPSAPNLVPFDFNSFNCCVTDSATNDDNNERASDLYILLETGLAPVIDNYMLQIEHFGQPIAWKVDTHLAILIKSDLHHMTELLLTTFMHDCLSINDGLPLMRVESVSIDGSAQPFESIKNHSRKDLINRSMRMLSPSQWDKHIIGLRSFGILASQAFEFEYNKMRTEGKTGIVKPDLIPNKNNYENSIEDEFVANSETLAPVIQMKSPNKLISPRISPKVSPKVSPLKQIAEVNFENHTHDDEGPSLEFNIIIPHQNGNLKMDEKLDKNIDKTFAVECKRDAENAEATKVDIVDSTSMPINAKSTISATIKDAVRPKLVRSKGSIISSKPPNILVFADSIATRDSVMELLNEILEEDTYTIYPLIQQQVNNRAWINSTTLLIVCGYVSPDVGPYLTEYFLKGGKMLSLCSDILHMILPTFRAHAEVREHELVQFSYGRWQNIKMMHHIFCYQPSPVRKHFSTESEESHVVTKKSSVEVLDQQQNKHSLHVQILGTEETWNTPSLILATSDTNGGKAIFSQIHLEADPNHYEHDDEKFNILKNSNRARIEILTDLLSSHLGIIIRTDMTRTKPIPSYTSAYFLGDHKLKFDFLQKIKPKMIEENTLKTTHLTMKFCNKGVDPPIATGSLIPILVNACPENFSTIEYFDNLRSEKFGRLTIFAPVTNSSMHFVENLSLDHGLVIIPYRQLNGSGRGGNKWISPEGSAMFTMQIYIPMSSVLGERISLLQLVAGVAVINAIRSVNGYENLDIRLKWPNDIYANGCVKVGGVTAKCIIESNVAVCNIGVGINFSNSTPTTCVQDLAREYNIQTNGSLEIISYERFLALIFTELEILFNRIQGGDLQYFYDSYINCWLHSNEQVTVIDSNGHGKLSEILGIDKYGYLIIRPNGEEPTSVQPDGNTFDMLQGLIINKF